MWQSAPSSMSLSVCPGGSRELLSQGLRRRLGGGSSQGFLDEFWLRFTAVAGQNHPGRVRTCSGLSARKNETARRFRSAVGSRYRGGKCGALTGHVFHVDPYPCAPRSHFFTCLIFHILILVFIHRSVNAPSTNNLYIRECSVLVHVSNTIQKRYLVQYFFIQIHAFLHALLS